MNCNEFTDRLWAFFEGELSEQQRRECKEHTKSCSDCDALLEKCAELPCRDFVQFLDDYVEDRLPPERTTIFERHLSVCRDCEAYLDGYRKTIALGRPALIQDLEDVPPDLVRAVLDVWKQNES